MEGEKKCKISDIMETSVEFWLNILVIPVVLGDIPVRRRWKVCILLL